MSEDRKVRWAVIRFMSGDCDTDEEIIEAELDLDDFQFWFQRNPKQPNFRQGILNLSLHDWNMIKGVPMVADRSDKDTI